MILIVDSEKNSEPQKKQMFFEMGFSSVVVAKNIESAREKIDLIEKEKITLVIIDAVLDDGNGFEFCREIKRHERTKNAYIMMMVSSVENKTAIENAKRNGASMFAVKPYISDGFQKRFFQYVATRVVVIVEDDPVICQVVKKILSQSNVEIIELDNGIKANNIFNKMWPSKLVLMDIGLPKINGIQLVEKIRSKHNWRKTPIVMLTGSSDATNVKKCLSAGANDYLTKPIDIDGFKKRLSRFLPDER